MDLAVSEFHSVRVTKCNSTKYVEVPGTQTKYELCKELGKGSFSKVKLARTHSGLFAMKIMHKGILKRQRCVIYDSSNTMNMSNNLEKVLSEIEIWRTLLHPNIVKLHEIINDPDHEYIYLTNEYCDLGQIMNWNLSLQKYELSQELVDRLERNHPAEYCASPSREEATAKLIFEHVARGLAHLHSVCVIHKDVKPDNILFSSADNNAKLTDFTISQRLETAESLCFNPPGTTPFQSPESMFSGNGFSGQKADVWALGTCLFAMVSGGFLPFWDSESEIQTQLAIQNKEPEYPEGLSPALSSLLRRVFEKDPAQRPCVEELLQDPWFGVSVSN